MHLHSLWNRSGKLLKLALLPVSKVCTNKSYIFRQCTCIVYMHCQLMQWRQQCLLNLLTYSIINPFFKWNDLTLRSILALFSFEVNKINNVYNRGTIILKVQNIYQDIHILQQVMIYLTDVMNYWVISNNDITIKICFNTFLVKLRRSIIVIKIHHWSICVFSYFYRNFSWNKKKIYSFIVYKIQCTSICGFSYFYRNFYWNIYIYKNISPIPQLYF